MKFRILLLFFLSLAGRLHAEEPYIGYSDYQIVTDQRFNAASYFEEMQSNGVNLQRIWVLGYSNTGTLRELMPFRKERRSYNLNELNPAYLKRLKSTLAEADRHGQKVLLTLFDRWSMARPSDFSRTPWYYKNNTDELLRTPFPTFYDLSNSKLVAIQKNLVQGIVRATSEFKPIYEIMNEARWQENCKGLDKFHDQVAQWIQEVDPSASISVNVSGNCPGVYRYDWVDLISFHAGQWQTDEICKTISKFRDLGKPILIDTDGAFKVRHDNLLVQSWLQETLSCGGWFNNKDDIYHPDTELLTIIREERERMKTPQSTINDSLQ